MINFSTLKGLTIPEGVVTKIADASGRVLWMLSGGKVILEVEKITSDTYAGETTYTGEQFILLDIYPKTNGTVKVTYGGLTKTIMDTSGAAEPNAQQVFFGTFNGVSDSVATPASGELTIEGDCYGFAVGTFKTSSKGGTVYYRGIFAISSLGSVDSISSNAFNSCTSISDVLIPKSVKTIGLSAFSGCSGLTNVQIENGLTSIYGNAFAGCRALEAVYIPKSVSFIDSSSFPKTIPSKLIIDSKNAFYKTDNGCLIDTTQNTVVTCFQNFIIPSYVSAIGADAGTGAGFTSVSIPGNVKVVGSNAFSNNSIDTINIAEGVEELGSNAFRNSITCSRLIIPSTVKSIGSGCFARCLKIYNYHVLSTTPPLISSDSLTVNLNTSLFHIYVPKGCSSAYKSASVWSDYAEKIVEVS